MPYLQTDPRTMPLGQLLSWVGRAVGERWRRAAGATGLSRTAVTLLMAIGDTDGLTQREIARHSQLSPATLTPAVDALAAAGLLCRERDAADRRLVRLHITEPGRARLTEALAQVRAELAPLFPELSAEDSDRIRTYLITLWARLHETRHETGDADGGGDTGRGAEHSPVQTDDTEPAGRGRGTPDTGGRRSGVRHG